MRRWGLIGGGVILLLALGALASRWIPALDLLAEIAPLLLAAAMVTLAAAVVPSGGRRPLAIAVALGACLACTVALAPALESAPLASPEKPGLTGRSARLRVIQINLGGGGLADPERAARWLAAQQPDVVFVDDLDRGLRGALERRGFLWRRGTAWTALATRGPLGPPAFSFSPLDWRIEPDVARARWTGQGGPAQLLGIHLERPWGVTARLATEQHVVLAGLVRRYEGCSLIVSGDLNLASWSWSLRRLERTTGLRRLDGIEVTWPARAPLGLAVLPLDHLLATPDWRVLSVRRGPDIGATHYPLVADLTRVGPPSGLRPSPCPGKPGPDTGRPT